MKKTFLWLIVAFCTLAFFAAVLVSLLPHRPSVEEAGGIELVYELNLKSFPPHAIPDGLASRVIEVLQHRVDPDRNQMIVWRIVDPSHIQVQIPFHTPASPDARHAKEDAKATEASAFAALQAAAWDESTLRDLIKKKGAARDLLLARFAAPDSPAYAMLQDLIAAGDALEKAAADVAAYKPGGTPAEETLLARRQEADAKFEQLLLDATLASVSPPTLRSKVLAADDPDDESAGESLAKYIALYPLQKRQINAYINAHHDLHALTDPGEMDAANAHRLITQAGVLDFRIAVLPNEISPDQRKTAIEVLAQKGPAQQVDAGDSRARWFSIDSASEGNLTRGGFVTTSAPEHSYILCYDDHAHTLTHSDPARDQWFVAASVPYSDPLDGGPVLPFNLDPKGAGYMAALTSAWKQHPMAILFDDRVMSAPNIQAPISDRGVITFGRRNAKSALAQAQQLKSIMDAGSLPVVVLPDPVSTREILPNPNYHPWPWRPILMLVPLAILVPTLILALRKPRPKPAQP